MPREEERRGLGRIGHVLLGFSRGPARVHPVPSLGRTPSGRDQRNCLLQGESVRPESRVLEVASQGSLEFAKKPALALPCFPTPQGPQDRPKEHSGRASALRTFPEALGAKLRLGKAPPGQQERLLWRLRSCRRDQDPWAHPNPGAEGTSPQAPHAASAMQLRVLQELGLARAGPGASLAPKRSDVTAPCREPITFVPLPKDIQKGHSWESSSGQQTPHMPGDRAWARPWHGQAKTARG